jgi:hypothetical protein
VSISKKNSVAEEFDIRARDKIKEQVYVDQFFFLLPITQELDTSGNISPLLSVNESVAQDITTENQVGERLPAKNATYR